MARHWQHTCYETNINLLLFFIFIFSPPQVALTPRFRLQHRRATKFHVAALTRPPAPPVPRHRRDITHLHPTWTTMAKGGDHLGHPTDKEVRSGGRSRPGRANLVLVLDLKAVSHQHLPWTTWGLSGETMCNNTFLLPHICQHGSVRCKQGHWKDAIQAHALSKNKK